MYQQKVPKSLKQLFYVSPAPDVMILPLIVTSDVLSKAPGSASKTWRADVELALDNPTQKQRMAFESRGKRIFLTDDMQFWNGQQLAASYEDAVRLAKRVIQDKIDTHTAAIEKLNARETELVQSLEATGEHS